MFLVHLDKMINIYYEDDHYLVVEKPAGLATHPQPRVKKEETLFYTVKEQTGHYLYPIHRLDRPVSGLLVFGLTKEGVRDLKEQWQTSVTKEYIALTKGIIDTPGIHQFNLSNDQKILQEAKTEYWPLYQFKEYTLVKIKIYTGRRHQIRRHFSRRMHPLVGDTAHGKGQINRWFREKYNLYRVFLHAYHLKFTHPFTNEVLDFQSPLPHQLEKIILDLDPNFKLPLHLL